MKYKIFITIIFLNILTLLGCSSKKTADDTSSSVDSTAVTSNLADSIVVLPADDSLPFIDLNKRYPLKKINLDEIADIKYIPLETTDKSLISFPNRLSLREGILTCYDYKAQEIVVFNSDGTYFTKVARKGTGPHEYQLILNSCVDFENQLIYILDVTFPRKIKVYDFDGYMQREFSVRDVPEIHRMYLFDKDRLIVFCDPNGSRDNKEKIGSYPYRFIDTTTGQSTPVDIEIPNPGSNCIRTYSGEHVRVSSFPISPMLKSNNEVIISDYVHPIVYRQKGTRFEPLLRKSDGSVSVDGKRELMSVIKAISDTYILFYVVEKSTDKEKGLVSPENPRHVLYNRLTHEICEVEFINPDTGNKVYIEIDTDFPQNIFASVYFIETLDRYMNNGSISGKLKEIVENMDPEDNPVLAIITFK